MTGFPSGVSTLSTSPVPTKAPSAPTASSSAQSSVVHRAAALHGNSDLSWTFQSSTCLQPSTSVANGLNVTNAQRIGTTLPPGAAAQPNCGLPMTTKQQSLAPFHTAYWEGGWLTLLPIPAPAPSHSLSAVGYSFWATVHVSLSSLQLGSDSCVAIAASCEPRSFVPTIPGYGSVGESWVGFTATARFARDSNSTTAADQSTAATKLCRLPTEPRMLTTDINLHATLQAAVQRQVTLEDSTVVVRVSCDVLLSASGTDTESATASAKSKVEVHFPVVLVVPPKMTIPADVLTPDGGSAVVESRGISSAGTVTQYRTMQFVTSGAQHLSLVMGSEEVGSAEYSFNVSIHTSNTTQSKSLLLQRVYMDLTSNDTMPQPRGFRVRRLTDRSTRRLQGPAGNQGLVFQLPSTSDLWEGTCAGKTLPPSSERTAYLTFDTGTVPNASATSSMRDPGMVLAELVNHLPDDLSMNDTQLRYALQQVPVHKLGQEDATFACPPYCPGTTANDWPTAAPMDSATTGPTWSVAYVCTCQGFATGSVCTTPQTAGQCAWGEGDDCKPCPEGALCPGGYRMWAQPGYWAADSQSSEVKQCYPPNADRCEGWSVYEDRTRCQPGHDPASPACQGCLPGYFPDGPNECSECPSIDRGMAQVWPGLRIVGVGVACLVLLILVLALYMLYRLRKVHRQRSMSLKGPIKSVIVQLIALGVWSMQLFMIILQAAQYLPLALPGLLRDLLRTLQPLLFQFPSVHPVCLGQPPMQQQTGVLAMAVALSVLFWTLYVIQSYPCHVCGKLAAWWLRHIQSSRVIARISKVLHILLVLYLPLAALTVMKSLDCRSVPMAGTNSEQRLLQWWPNVFVRCYSDQHTPAATLAILALLLHIVGIPAVSMIWLLRSRSTDAVDSPLGSDVPSSATSATASANTSASVLDIDKTMTPIERRRARAVTVLTKQRSSQRLPIRSVWMYYLTSGMRPERFYYHHVIFVTQVLVAIDTQFLRDRTDAPAYMWVGWLVIFFLVLGRTVQVLWAPPYVPAKGWIVWPELATLICIVLLRTTVLALYVEHPTLETAKVGPDGALEESSSGWANALAIVTFAAIILAIVALLVAFLLGTRLSADVEAAEVERMLTVQATTAVELLNRNKASGMDAMAYTAPTQRRRSSRRHQLSIDDSMWCTNPMRGVKSTKTSHIQPITTGNDAPMTGRRSVAKARPSLLRVRTSTVGSNFSMFTPRSPGRSPSPGRSSRSPRSPGRAVARSRSPGRTPRSTRAGNRWTSDTPRERLSTWDLVRGVSTSSTWETNPLRRTRSRGSSASRPRLRLSKDLRPGDGRSRNPSTATASLSPRRRVPTPRRFWQGADTGAVCTSTASSAAHTLRSWSSDEDDSFLIEVPDVMKARARARSDVPVTAGTWYYYSDGRADNVVWGPYTTEEVTEWLLEGHLNAVGSMSQYDGATGVFGDWRPMNHFINTGVDAVYNALLAQSASQSALSVNAVLKSFREFGLPQLRRDMQKQLSLYNTLDRMGDGVITSDDLAIGLESIPDPLFLSWFARQLEATGQRIM